MAERGELDLTGAKQNTGVWLVKVPKYLSQQWAKAPGRGEVGKLRIAKNQGRTEVSFTLNEDLANIHDIGGKPASVSAPREHPFVLQSVGGQTLTVFTESSSDKLSLEGIVVQRAECRPAANENYMRLKRLQIEESSKPVRLSQQLDKVVTTNYKPVANHQYNHKLKLGWKRRQNVVQLRLHTRTRKQSTSLLLGSHLSVWFFLRISCCSHAFRETNSLRRTVQIVECSLLHRQARGSLLLAKDPDQRL
ncbi:general transcription factor IIF subunit 2 isoform X2 [Bubalus kerabau]|uniref:general transcription factor IIF subunit 2 isoform X2 n=1 Tax=Bubalus carabanensis TaxID=3119969 RepID=UPI00244EE1CF|nr:general transcription factor IIF subunit 2 isoform X2 [Bubalus carabanensis]